MFHHHPTIKSVAVCLCIFILFVFRTERLSATAKTTASSGDWNTAATWNPAGVPVSTDDITIGTGHAITVSSDASIHTVTIAAGGTLTWSTSNTLTIGGSFIVNGAVLMNGGNISLTLTNASFILGAYSSFTWQPGNNTAAGATLFTKGLENFSSSSTLIIKKWYSYAVPLGSVVSGTFGNLVLNSVNASNLIVEWNQSNYFQVHKINGTLTIDQGWITLDKSGSITSTSIGSIVLTSVNSSFYGHNGTHPSSFTLITGNVTNNGGTFYGLNDGNGNITVTVNGNFSTIGNVKIINNTGVGGVSNGNATFNVAGTFSQNTGDTRIVYNVTTLNSGIFSATFGNLILNGGIFMGQTGIHVAGGTSTMNITNHFTINFSNASDKFRGTSLSSIGSTMNTTKFNLTIGGNLTVGGVSASEFTSSASSGSETISMNGNFQVNGTTLCFNYGAMTASHAMQLTLGGSLTINGGGTFLSRNGGTIAATINGNISIVSGNLSLKGDTGSAVLNVTGSYNQSGGNFYLHNNVSTITRNSISTTVLGNFSQSAGIINFDNNSSSLSATHTLNIAGANYSLSGTGSMTHGGAGTASSFGQLNFIRSGIINFNRTSNSHSIQQVKQNVLNGCTLDIGSGNIQVASHTSASTDYFRVAAGGTVNTRNGQFVSNGFSVNSGLKIDSAGTVKTYSTNGFYNGLSNACINASYNFNFFLHPHSIVEYNGVNNQTISGLGVGVAATSNHRYGILRVNFNGDDNTEYVAPASSNVFVRTKLDLVQGELNLNGYTLTIESGSPSAVTRTNGYIKSEKKSANNTSILTWKNMAAGNHRFPFGVNSAAYLPVDFTPFSGFGGDVSISTRATATSDNKPFPSAILDTLTNTLSVGGNAISTAEIIDRWWNIKATGFSAKVMLTYQGTENTSTAGNSNDPVKIIQWNGVSWNPPTGNGIGVISHTGTVTVNVTTTFSDWGVVRDPNALPIKLTAFNVIPGATEVYVNWTTTTEINNDHFNIERSIDGINFENIQQVNGAGNSSTSRSYSYVDKSPITGTTYYRLKQTDYDGHFAYSEIKVIRFPDFSYDGISIDNFGPNPFENTFWVNYHLAKKGLVTFRLTAQNGQLLHTEEMNAEEGVNRYEFTDHSNLKQGIYLLNILSNNKRITQKIIKK